MKHAHAPGGPGPGPSKTFFNRPTQQTISILPSFIDYTIELHTNAMQCKRKRGRGTKTPFHVLFF